jgi:galactarate dehydratase
VCGFAAVILRNIRQLARFVLFVKSGTPMSQVDQRAAAAPRYVRVHPDDNVAIVVNDGGLPAGAQFADGLTLRERTPQAHKIALRDLGAGDPVVRYGQTIGYATRRLAAGSWVREEMISLPDPPPLDDLPLATATPPAPAPLHGYEFEGYVNADGSVGTRNLLGITTTVQCVAPTVDYAVERIRREILPRFPAVDDVAAITHGYGCGVAIDAPGAAIPIRTLHNISLHANLGGAPLIVSLGCEKLQPARLFPEYNFDAKALRVIDEGPYLIRLQDQELRGFGDIVAAIMRAAEKRLEELNRRRRRSCPASDLVVGLQCGGSDAFSGVTCNPAVGYAADLLVRAGATVLFSEVTEVRDAVHLLTPRAKNPDVGRALIREMKWYDDYLTRGGADRSANPTPGNKRGGLANVVEKALGSIAKAGSTAIVGVASHGERVRTKGLVFAATPASDFICGTQQLASMNIHVFTTGEGSPYGMALVPVIKISSRTALAERWHDLIDVDAGRIATGQATIEQVGREIFQLILDVASGRKTTWAEKWRLHNALVPFNPGPVT